MFNWGDGRRDLEHVAEHGRLRRDRRRTVALLMIGGEFDSRPGVMIGSSGLLLGIPHERGRLEHLAGHRRRAPVRPHDRLPERVTVVRTGLPSFIVTLGTFFVLRGLNAGLTIKLTGGVSIGTSTRRPGSRARERCSRRSSGTSTGSACPSWWLGVTAVVPGCSHVRASATGSSAQEEIPSLHATSESPSRERRSSSHDDVVRGLALGVMTAISCAGSSRTKAWGASSSSSSRPSWRLPAYRRLRLGDRTAFGAAILGMAQIGIISSNWDSNYVYLFEGVILVLAVMLNTAIRSRRRRRDDERAHQPPDSPPRARRDLEVFRQRRALTDVSAFVNAGEVTCILGDNGAGKSTLIKVSPACTSRRGTCAGGRCGGSVQLAARHACLWIATVYQDLAMVPLMSIWRNFFLGAEPTKGIGPFKALRPRSRRANRPHELLEMGIDIRDPDQPVGHAVGRRAAVHCDRTRDPLRRPRAHPRRADLRPGRQAGRDRAQVHPPGTRPRSRVIFITTTHITLSRSLTTSSS